MRRLVDILFEDSTPGNAPPENQVHVFDFDDTLGVTTNANGVMLYRNGRPAHKTKKEVTNWLGALGVSKREILDPGIVSIRERDGGMAVYLTSLGLARVQRNFPATKQGVTTGYADKVEQPGETILIDFTPSSSTDVKSTKPIKSTINKMKREKEAGSATIVITARKASGTGVDFHGKPVEASNAEDMEKFLAKFGANPTDGVMGVTGQNKGHAIINKYIAGDKVPPEEVHFYDDLKKNTDEVEDAVAEKVPSELYIYGPGEFAHGGADPENPNKVFPPANPMDKSNSYDEDHIMERWVILAGIKG